MPVEDRMVFFFFFMSWHIKPYNWKLVYFLFHMTVSRQTSIAPQQMWTYENQVKKNRDTPYKYTFCMTSLVFNYLCSHEALFVHCSAFTSLVVVVLQNKTHGLCLRQGLKLHLTTYVSSFRTVSFPSFRHKNVQNCNFLMHFSPSDAFSNSWQRCCPVCHSRPGKWKSLWGNEAGSWCHWQEGPQYGKEKGMNLFWYVCCCFSVCIFVFLSHHFSVVKPCAVSDLASGGDGDFWIVIFILKVG